MQNKVLIVEDDSDLKEGLDFSLSEEGYMVVAVETLKEAEKCFKNDLEADILTNPPYKYAKEFVEKSIRL